MQRQEQQQQEQKYKIKELKKVKLSELEPHEIRDPRRREDQETRDSMRDSIESFTIVQPLLVRDKNGDGKYPIWDGNRRYKQLKEMGITEDIPIAIVDADSDKTMRKAALISNSARIAMEPDDIAKTLVEIYADADYTNLSKIAALLQDIFHGTFKGVPKDFKKISRSTGIGAATQWRHLQEYRYFHPETKKVMREAKKHSQEKTRLLIAPGIREDAELQTATAVIIKDMQNKEATEFVMRIKSGEVDKEILKKHRGIVYKSGIDPNEMREGSLSLDGATIAATLIRILAGMKKKDHDKYSDELIAKGKNWRLQSMKMMQVQDLNRLYNHLSFLQELINEILPVLYKESEVRKKKDQIMKT